jgi:thioesterase-3
MHASTHRYTTFIKEAYLDSFGHMNNAMYLTLLEEARWDLINRGGYGLEAIRAKGIGPTILEIHLRFLKELRLRDEITIETHLASYERKIGIISQKIFRQDILCCTAELTIGLFDLKERKLIPPTPEWLKAIGVE